NLRLIANRLLHSFTRPPIGVRASRVADAANSPLTSWRMGWYVRLQETAVDFRILGPLEVRLGERVVALGGPRQRSVLAVLLLHANEVVARDTLVDEVWGPRPPPAATASLQ